MKKLSSLSLILFLFIFSANAQFSPVDFKASCDCTFEKEFEKTLPSGYTLKSYICNSNTMGDVALYRVTLMDLSKDLNRMTPEEKSRYAASYHATLLSQFQQAGLATTERQYKGAKAIEYSQMVKHDGETLPQKTMVFVQDKRSVTLQLLSSSGLIDRQFDEFKNGFMLLQKQ